MTEPPAEQPLVPGLDRQQPAPLRPAGAPQQVGQHRRHDQRQQDRHDERDAERDRQRAEEEAGNAGQQQQRQEDHDIGGGRADQRPGDPPGGAADRDMRRDARLERQLAGDRFDDDDDLVDDQPDGDRQPAEGHEVQGQAGALDDQDGDRQRHRDDRRRHQRGAQAAQEAVDDEQRQHGADQPGLGQRQLRGVDQPGLVPVAGHLDVRRQALEQRRHPRLERALQADGVGADHRVRAQQHGMPGVERRLLQRRPLAERDRRDGAERDLGAGPPVGHRHRAECRRVVQRLADEDDAALIAAVERPRGMGGIGVGDRRLHLADGGARGGERRGIERDAIFDRRPAEHRHAAEAGQAGEGLADLLLDQEAQPRLRHRRRGQRIGDDRLHVGMLDDGLDAGHRAEAGAGGGDHRLDALQVGPRVAWLVKERVSSTGSTLSAASSGRVTVARISSGGRLPAQAKISMRENETCGKMLRGAA